MSDEEFNMSMRKFLKQVGVTSQQAIEEAMQAAGASTTARKSFDVKVVLTIGELDMTHVVSGQIAGKT